MKAVKISSGGFGSSIRRSLLQYYDPKLILKEPFTSQKYTSNYNYPQYLVVTGTTLIKSKNSRIAPSVLCPRSGGRIGGPRGSPVLLTMEANVMHSPRDPCNTRSSITSGEDSTPRGGRPAQHTSRQEASLSQDHLEAWKEFPLFGQHFCNDFPLNK